MDGLIVNSIISQLFYFVIFLFIAGFIISLLNKWFYQMTNYNRAVLYGTSFIGTPIHELSHALMCIVFMHKIEEIKLFQVNDADGVLGYVSHSYNKKNIWALIGNFFIGTAPILCGSLLLFFSMRWLMPSVYVDMTLYAEDLQTLTSNGFTFDTILYLLATAFGFIECILASFSFTVEWFFFAIIAMCIALHMNLSTADIKGALPSLPFIIIIIVLVNVILGNLATGLYLSYLNFINMVGSFLMAMLIFSLVVSLGYILVVVVIKYGIGALSKLKK